MCQNKAKKLNLIPVIMIGRSIIIKNNINNNNDSETKKTNLGTHAKGSQAKMFGNPLTDASQG